MKQLCFVIAILVILAAAINLKDWNGLGIDLDIKLTNMEKSILKQEYSGNII